MQFGLAIADIFEDLKATASGCPADPKQPISGIQAFLQAQASPDGELYKYAGLPSVFSYLRGCKALRIPDSWQPHVPVVVD